MHNLIFRGFFVVLILTQMNCGGSGDSSGGDVNAIIVDDSVINVGGASVVQVEFSFDADEVFNHSREVIIVLHLAPGIVFHPGSGEVDIPGGNDLPASGQITNCNTGDSFVLFNLNKQDLLTADNPSGDADARLTLTIDAIAPGTSTIEGEAGDVATFACGQEFNAQATAIIEVH